MILVVGCPRSGTCFISTLFKEHGFDVGHEAWGRDGIACWRLAGNSDFWRGFNLCPREIQGAHPAVHQVRHPLGTISSLLTIAEVSWDIMAKSIPLRTKHPLHRAMQAYILWNRLAQQRASYTYRVENIRQEYPELCRRAGFVSTLKPDFATSEKTNGRPHESLSWADLESVDAPLAMQVRALSVEYGYTL